MRPGTVFTVALAAAITTAVMAHWKHEHYWPISKTVVARYEAPWLAELSIRLLVSGLIIVALARGALLVAAHWPDGGLPERGQVIRPRRWQQAA